MNQHKGLTFILSIIFSILITPKSSYAQEVNEIEKLATTAKVWGFLKYYHPQNGKDKYDWDQHLLNQLESLEHIKNTDELSDYYISWLDGLGKVKKCRKCNKAYSKKEYTGRNFDLSWLGNEAVFSQTLIERLKQIEQNRYQKNERFLYKKSKYKFGAKTLNEHYLSADCWQNQNERLLILFRYWNVIEYFFPYKYMIDMNWDEVLIELIPVFLNAKTETDFHYAVMKMTAKIQDGHGIFISKLLFGTYELNTKNQRLYLPVSLEVVEGQTIVTDIKNDSLAMLHDWQVGDIVIEVEGKSVADIYKEGKQYISASNSSTLKQLLPYYFIGVGLQDSLNITISRNSKTEQKLVKRYPYHQKKNEEPHWKIIDGDVGFVNIGELTHEEVPSMMDELMDTKAIIFDLRAYPKMTMPYITRYLSPTRRVYAKFCTPDLKYVGNFFWKRKMSLGSPSTPQYKGKVIGLVNEKAISQAETSVMALEALDNTTIIGSQSCGANGNVVFIPLFEGCSPLFSSLGFYYPDGKPIQRVGIVPDIEVTPTIKGIINGRDEVLEKALEVIKRDNNSVK